MARDTRVRNCPPCAMIMNEPCLQINGDGQHVQDLLIGDNEGAPRKRIILVNDGQTIEPTIAIARGLRN